MWREGLHEDLCEPLSVAGAKYLWHTSFTGRRGAITVIYEQTAHHGISFSKWYTAIHQWIPTCAIFLSNRGRVSAERAGELLLITDTRFDGWRHVKQSNLLQDTYTWLSVHIYFNEGSFDHQNWHFVIFGRGGQKKKKKRSRQLVFAASEKQGRTTEVRWRCETTATWWSLK